MIPSKDKGIELIEGFDKILESNAEVLDGEEWVARVSWRRYFRRAWLIRMKKGMFITWQTAPVPGQVKDTDRAIFVWAMGTGNYSRYPQPTGEFLIHINGEKVISFCVSTNNRCWSRDDYRFYYEIKRRESECSYGLGYLLVPKAALRSSSPATIKVSSVDTDSERWFMVCQYGEGNLDQGVSFSEPNARPTFVDEGISAVLKGVEHYSSSGLQLYWGDMHVHSNMANYVGASAEQNYEYGRLVSQLDFMAITDQDHFLNDRQFDKVITNANRHYVPREFVTFIGYEWSSRLFGHRNVIFRGDRGILIRRHDIEKPYEPPYARENRDSFYQLCEGLKKFGEPCMLIPHHPSMTSMGALDWSVFDPELEAAVEIYSLWGNSEDKNAPARSLSNDQCGGSFVQDALARGYCLGIIASGETGDGHPGNTQWRRKYALKAGFPLNPLGGGLTAVWAAELSRESIFDAIKSRRCYGTTNARILLEFKLNGQWMGEKIQIKKSKHERGFPVHVDINVKGADKVEGIYILRNGNITDFAPGHGDEMNCAFTQSLTSEHFLEVNDQRFAYYYVRVHQKDGHMAWSSPVWVSEER